MIHRRLIAIPSFLLLIVVLAACGSNGTPVGTITSIVTNVAESRMLTPGDEVALDLRFTGSGAIPTDVTFESSDPLVATIDEDFTITARNPGDATITITSIANQDVQASITVFVTDALPSDEAFGMTDPAVAAGVLLGDAIASTETIMTTESLTVNAEGLTTTLTALTPTGESIPILTTDTLPSAAAGGQLSLVGSGYEPGTPVGVFIGADNTQLGTTTVTPQGTYRVTIPLPDTLEEGVQAITIIGEKAQDTEMSAQWRGARRSGKRVRTAVVNWFNPRITGIEVRPASLELAIGETRTLDLAVQSAGSIDTSVTWTSSNIAVATVNGSGTVEALTSGTSTITATSNADGTQSASTMVTVLLDPHSPTLSTLEVGTTLLEPNQSTPITVTLIQPDGTQRPASGGALTFAPSTLGTFTSVRDNEDGTYTATFTAGTTEGTATLLALLDGAPLASSQAVTIEAPKLFRLADNGVTILCPDAEVGDSGSVNGIEYTKRSRDDGTVVSSIDALVDAGDGPEGWDLLPATCTSGITDMTGLFSGAFANPSPFNEDISSWDVSSVTDMKNMFLATRFAGDLNDWDVSSVVNMSYMFWAAPDFNGNVSSWNVGSVKNFSGMFQEASSFNGNIGGWDTKNATEMGFMFREASNFNQDLSGWCVTNIKSKPTSFNFLASSDWTTNGDLQPQWGSCPE